MFYLWKLDFSIMSFQCRLQSAGIDSCTISDLITKNLCRFNFLISVFSCHCFSASLLVQQENKTNAVPQSSSFFVSCLPYLTHTHTHTWHAFLGCWVCLEWRCNVIDPLLFFLHRQWRWERLHGSSRLCDRYPPLTHLLPDVWRCSLSKCCQLSSGPTSCRKSHRCTTRFHLKL